MQLTWACTLLIVSLAAAGNAQWNKVLRFAGMSPVAVAAVPNLSLQAQVDQSPPGSMLLVPPGSYEGPLVITKPIELRGEQGGTVTLHHTGDQPTLRIEAEHVKIAGLQIVDEGHKEAPAIQVLGNEILLDDLVVRTASTAILIQDSREVEIMRSSIEWNGAADTMPFARRNGVDLYQAHDILLSDNTIVGMRDGIYLENSDNVKISGNRIEGSRYGIHSMYTHGTVIRENTGAQNVTGAMVMAARDVQVTGNVFAKQDQNVHAQGILLYDVHESVVRDNTVEGNRVGLYVEQATHNEILDNRLSYNFIGLQLMKTENNVIRGNAFIGNVSDAQAKNSTENKLAGNYWDTFQGIDIDGDGLSDTSYAIHPFFVSLTQQRPVFQLFFQSPGIRFLESFVETERNEWTTDPSPLMEPPESIRSNHDKADRRTGITGMLLLGCSCLLLFRFRRKKA
ncbi:ABC transporter substrate-binding protein [Xylanibacillus composti]|uniref:NosD protein n=1 Tax=Xylanibacillus composti TaxID=1572762 RepID=A0A8J4H6G5_9BACL|nr:NosD domain-containing protein [Xylanibacillus composti]MDT9727003.1 ABC transporter substrate-binding protein [Xylanibacillus composti]GIQ69563.1 NosD protein [Xylanibacillus composti]